MVINCVGNDILQPQNTIAKLYQSTNLSCLAAAVNPQLSYQWFKDGVLLDGETGWLIIIQSIQLTDRGTYYCTARNSMGFIQSDFAVLNIEGENLVHMYHTPITSQFCNVWYIRRCNSISCGLGCSN